MAGAIRPRIGSRESTAVTTVTESDPDAGQTLTFRSPAARTPRLYIDANNGALTFAWRAPDFEAPADAGGDNVYDVTVQVSDGNGGTDTQAIAVTLQNIAGLTITGTNQGQTLTGTGEEISIFGLGGPDTLQGLAGNDTLDGGSGKDTMVGGSGNDTYVIDNRGDAVTENASEGIDTILVDHLHTRLQSGEPHVNRGQQYQRHRQCADNLITGNSGNNILAGLGGADTLDGGPASIPRPMQRLRPP